MKNIRSILMHFAVLSLNCQYATAQNLRIVGVVIDQNGAPISGAEVTLVTRAKAGMETVSAATDANGKFVFDNAGDPSTLTVRARGFAAASRTLHAADPDASNLRITLAPASLSDQITVTADRTETRVSDTAASVQVLSSEDLSTTAALTVDDVLRQVPGFSLFRRSGSRTANPTSQGVSLRGVGASGASRAVVL